VSRAIDAYEAVTSGPVLWETDGRHGRPDNVTYRESLHATYQGPYTRGKQYAWDGLVGNTSGLVGSDPERGFVLTMPAGQAQAGSYTTRDFASAPHGVDYRPHFDDWTRDHDAHPNLLLPGRTALFQGARLGALELGDDLLGTGGCCVQDWVGLDFPTMAEHGNTRMSEYTGCGFAWLPSGSPLARATRIAGRRKDHPFTTPRRGVAPLLVMMARDKGWMKGRVVHLDPQVPHEFAAHWHADGSKVDLWVDRQLVLGVREGAWAIPTGTRTRGRVRFSRSGFHLCCWQDNGAGTMDVQGAEGHPDRDQPYTIERFAVVGT
jgi:hypothetical protein